MAKTYWKRDHCGYCGHFISYNNYASYQPPGNANDLEPPAEEFICLRCWDDMTPEEQQRIRNIAVGDTVVTRDGKRFGWSRRPDDGRDWWGTAPR